MKITIDASVTNSFEGPRIGDVYAVRGGRGASRGHMQVLIAITESEPYIGPSALFLVIDKDGRPVNVTRYGFHAIEERVPIAIVEGLDKLELIMRGI